jgi:hypothetical protein
MRRSVSSAIVLSAVLYALAVVLMFWPFFLKGFSFLPTDLYLMLYKPFSARFPGFSPFNHFDDDILKFCYFYQWGAREYLYRPYWVPEIFGGVAQYANTYASHFSPWNWVLTLGPLEITYPLRLLISVWVAGISMCAFGLGMGLHWGPAFFSGLAYMFSSLFMALLLRWWGHAPFSWFPLVLLAAFLSFRRPLFMPIAAVALGLAFLDGFLQSSASLILALGLFLLVLGYRERGYWGIARAVAVGSVILVLAFSLTAIMWLPQLEYFYWDALKGQSRLEGVYYGKSLLQRIASVPLLFFGATFPQLLGTVRTLDLTKFARSNLQDFSLFAGSITLVLGLATFWLRNKFSAVWMAVAALAVAGLVIPTFSPLDRYVYFRFLAVYLLGICALAGLGLEKAEELRKEIRLGAWGLSLLTAGVFLGSLLLMTGRKIFPGSMENSIQGALRDRVGESTIGSRNVEWMVARGEKFLDLWSLQSAEIWWGMALLAASAALLFLWARSRVTKNQFISISSVLVFSQLYLFTHSWHGFRSLTEFPVFPENEIAKTLRNLDPESEFRAFVDDFHGIGKEKQIIPSNTNFFYGYRTLEGFDGIRPLTAYDAIGPSIDWERLGNLNVKYLLTNPNPLRKDNELRLVYRGVVAIYENKFAQGQARLLNKAEIGSFEEIRNKVMKEGAPKNFAYVEKPLALARNGGGTVSRVSATRNKIEYRVRSEGSSLFLASNSYYPGWRARWNGTEIEILRANAMMQAVVLPAGEGLLEFSFEPGSYRTGRAITLVTAAIFLLGLLSIGLGRMRKKML